MKVHYFLYRKYNNSKTENLLGYFTSWDDLEVAEIEFIRDNPNFTYYSRTYMTDYMSADDLKELGWIL